ncbi:MAG: hypothetical protein M1837_000511 [Sclerophora amabilis]|nr:MAG: hypothetical protein M1837_000511 [Sclerophora amabilis]
MRKPSDGWTGLEAANDDSRLLISKLLSCDGFQYLKERAIATRIKLDPSTPGDLGCMLELDRFLCGMNNVVLELAFSDGLYWIARVKYRMETQKSQVDQLTFESEVATLRLLRERTTIPVPTIYDHQSSTQSPFGFPYMLMEYLPGRSLEGPLAMSIPTDYHAKLARQFANILSELQKISRSQIGRLWRDVHSPGELEVIGMDWHALPGPLTTSLEFFHAEASAIIKGAIANHPNDPEWITACWMVKTGLNRFIMPERVVHGPFPLCHLDLHHGNLLFDDRYNLTGVIDWSHAQTVPIERMAFTPELMIAPGLSDAENQPTREFRRLVVECLKESEDRREVVVAGEATSLSSFIESERYDIAHWCINSNSRQILWMGKLVAKHVFKDCTWEQLVTEYGEKGGAF